jgi:hypothetical protein
MSRIGRVVAIDAVESADLDTADKAAILGGNARRLLGLT